MRSHKVTIVIQLPPRYLKIYEIPQLKCLPSPWGHRAHLEFCATFFFLYDFFKQAPPLS